jgi:hypothetical protein
MKCDKCQSDNTTLHFSSKGNKVYCYQECNRCREVKNIQIRIRKRRKRRFGNYIPGFNYCGPFTDLKYNLENNIKPKNELDRICMNHDIAYSVFKSNTMVPDIMFIRDIKNIDKRLLTLKEKLLLPIFNMSIKTKLMFDILKH